MDQRAILLEDYERILLTDLPHDVSTLRWIRDQYENGRQDSIKPVLLHTSHVPDMFFILDGTHRVAMAGRLGRIIQSYILQSDDDRDQLWELIEGGTLSQTDSIAAALFLSGERDLYDLISCAEHYHEMNGSLDLRRYLERRSAQNMSPQQ